MPEPGANDFAAIRTAMLRIKGERLGCNLRKGLLSSECWCYHAGPNGDTLPCPPPESAAAELGWRFSAGG